jgi:hypothetical protein
MEEIGHNKGKLGNKIFFLMSIPYPMLVNPKVALFLWLRDRMCIQKEKNILFEEAPMSEQ